jgi:nucleotide-binding universal stress UspA family protein
MSDKPVILVPTDFTPVGDSAVEYATRLAKLMHARVHLLHVVAKEKDSAMAKNALETIVSRLEKASIPSRAIVAVGNIFDDIGKVASEEQAKLIVMGTHGVKGLQHLIGSKALKVITNSDVPYVVVQKKPMKEQGFREIVIPVDFNQEVKQSVRYAWEIGKYFNAKIHIVYVKEKDPFIAAKIERNIPVAEEMLREKKVDYVISGIDKKNFARDVISYSTTVDADLVTIINNHENIFTYFGGSFEQTIIGNDAEIAVMVINAYQMKTDYSFSIYFA